MAKAAESNTKTIKLLIPITLGSGDLLEEVTLREIRAGDHRKAAQRCKNDPIATEYAVMAAVTGLQQEDFDLLSWKDVSTIRTFLFGDDV